MYVDLSSTYVILSHLVWGGGLASIMKQSTIILWLFLRTTLKKEEWKEKKVLGIGDKLYSLNYLYFWG